MSSEWKNVKLVEVLELITKGTTPPKGKGFVEDSGINYIKSDAISYDGQIDTSKFVQIDQETHDKFKRSQIRKDDILFSMAGAFLGKNAVVPEHLLPANTNQALAIIRVNQNKAVPKYISFGLRNPSMISYVNSMTAQSAQPNINFKEISSLPFNLPPLPEQKAIAHILGTLDEKIELNRQMNQTLEAMAQALFKSWFVDFDPVMDNALACGAEIPEALKAKAEKRLKKFPELKYGQNSPPSQGGAMGGRKTNPELAKLFPSAFVFDEELRKWIPEGWEVKTLGEITTELRRGISPKYLDEGGVRVLNQKCIRNHEVDFSLARRNDPGKKKVDGRFLKPFDMVVNSTGTGTLGRVANIISLDEPTVVDSHVTILRPNVELVSRNYFNGLIFSIETTIEAMGEGSTGQTELSRARLSELNVLIAPKQIQKSIDQILERGFVKKDKNNAEIQTLTQLRDTLLPQLISGKVRVPERTVEKIS